MDSNIASSQNVSVSTRASAAAMTTTAAAEVEMAQIVAAVVPLPPQQQARDGDVVDPPPSEGVLVVMGRGNDVHFHSAPSSPSHSSSSPQPVPLSAAVAPPSLLSTSSSPCSASSEGSSDADDGDDDLCEEAGGDERIGLKSGAKIQTKGKKTKKRGGHNAAKTAGRGGWRRISGETDSSDSAAMAGGITARLIPTEKKTLWCVVIVFIGVLLTAVVVSVAVTVAAAPAAGADTDGREEDAGSGGGGVALAGTPPPFSSSSAAASSPLTFAATTSINEGESKPQAPPPPTSAAHSSTTVPAAGAASAAASVAPPTTDALAAPTTYTYTAAPPPTTISIVPTMTTSNITTTTTAAATTVVPATTTTTSTAAASLTLPPSAGTLTDEPITAEPLPAAATNSPSIPTVPPSPTGVTVNFPPHLQQCVPNTTTIPSSAAAVSVGGEGPFVRSITMRRDVIVSSKQHGSSGDGGGGDAPEVHRRPPYVEAELQLLSKLGYAEYMKKAVAIDQDMSDADVTRAQRNWINTLPRASMGEDEVRCPAAAQSADPVEAVMAREATEAHALALMLYNQLKDTIQMNVIDSSPVVMDIGCVLGEVFARNHPKATVVCVHSGETFDTYPTVATGTNGTAAAGSAPSNLFHIFAMGESLIADTRFKFAFARIFEMCNYISVTFALGALRRDLVSRPGSIYATEEGLLALITRLLPPSLLLYTTAPAEQEGGRSAASPPTTPARGGNANDAIDNGLPQRFKGNVLSQIVNTQYKAGGFYEVVRGGKQLPAPSVNTVSRVIGTAQLPRSHRQHSDNGTAEEEEEEGRQHRPQSSLLLSIVQYTQLSSQWVCRKFLEANYRTFDKCVLMSYTTTPAGNSRGGNVGGAVLGGRGRIGIVIRGDSVVFRSVHPLEFLNSFSLIGLVSTGLSNGTRRILFGHMVAVGRYADPATHNWVLSEGGRAMRIDRMEEWYIKIELPLYYARKTTGYHHYMSALLCLPVGPDGRPLALWDVDRLGGSVGKMWRDPSASSSSSSPSSSFSLEIPSDDYTSLAADRSFSSPPPSPAHCATMCQACSAIDNHCYKAADGKICVPYCTECSQCVTDMAMREVVAEFIATYQQNLQHRRRIYHRQLLLLQNNATSNSKNNQSKNDTAAPADAVVVVRGGDSSSDTSSTLGDWGGGGVAFSTETCSIRIDLTPTMFEAIHASWEISDAMNITGMPPMRSVMSFEKSVCVRQRSQSDVMGLPYYHQWSASLQQKKSGGSGSANIPIVPTKRVRPASVQRALNTIAADFGGDEEAYLRHANEGGNTFANDSDSAKAEFLTREEIALAKGQIIANSSSGATTTSSSSSNSIIPPSFGWLGQLEAAPMARFADCADRDTGYGKEDQAMAAMIYNTLKDSIQRTLMVGGRTVDGNIGEAYGNEDLGSGGSEDTSGDRPKNASYSHTSAPTVLDIGCVVGEVFARHHPQATVICVHIGRRYTTDPSPYYTDRNGLTAYPTNIIHVFSREEDISAPTFFTPSSPAAPLANLLDQCHYFTMAFVLTEARDGKVKLASPIRTLLKRIIPVALTVYGSSYIQEDLGHPPNGINLSEEINDPMMDPTLPETFSYTRASVVSTLVGSVHSSRRGRGFAYIFNLVEYRQRYSERRCVVGVADADDAKMEGHKNKPTTTTIIRSSFIKHSEGLFWRDAVVSDRPTTTAGSAAPNPSRYVAMNPLSYAAQIPRVDVALLLRVGIDAYTRTLMLGRVLTAVSRLESNGGRNASTLKGVQGIVTRSMLSQLLGTAGGSIDTAADRAELGRFPAGWGVGLGGQLVGPSTDFLPSGASPTGSASAPLTPPQNLTEHLCLPPLHMLAGTLFTTGRVDDVPLLTLHNMSVMAPTAAPRPPPRPTTPAQGAQAERQREAIRENMKRNAAPDMMTRTLSVLLKKLSSFGLRDCVVHCSKCSSQQQQQQHPGAEEAKADATAGVVIVADVGDDSCSRCGSCLVTASAAGRGLRFPFLPLEPYVEFHMPESCPRTQLRE